jgi:hypothetical protein
VGSVVDGVGLLAPLAADRAGKPPSSSSLADEKRVGSLLLSTAVRDPVLDCSLRSLRIALESRLLRRRSPTRSVSARSSSVRRRAIRSAQPAHRRTESFARLRPYPTQLAGPSIGLEGRNA